MCGGGAPEVRLWGLAEGWRAHEKRLVGLSCESGMEFPLSKNFNEQQKIYEEAQRSSPNDEVKGLPMGACHRRPLNEVKCKARVGYWQPRRCRWGAGGGVIFV